LLLDLINAHDVVQMSEKDSALLLEQERVNAAMRRRDALMKEVDAARNDLDERTRALQQTHDSLCDMEKKVGTSLA